MSVNYFNFYTVILENLNYLQLLLLKKNDNIQSWKIYFITTENNFVTVLNTFDTIHLHVLCRFVYTLQCRGLEKFIANFLLFIL